VKLVRCGTAWRVDETMIGLEYNETGRVWDVYGTVTIPCAGRSLTGAVKALLAGGHIPRRDPEGSAS
jgi:hypothetical protein